MNTKQIINAMGAEAVMARLGVTKFSIRAARRDGSFPASWYEEMSRMGEEFGVSVPISLFNMRRGDAA
jgi:hypothetical protein